MTTILNILTILVAIALWAISAIAFNESAESCTQLCLFGDESQALTMACLTFVSGLLIFRASLYAMLHQEHEFHSAMLRDIVRRKSSPNDSDSPP